MLNYDLAQPHDSPDLTESDVNMAYAQHYRYFKGIFGDSLKHEHHVLKPRDGLEGLDHEYVFHVGSPKRAIEVFSGSRSLEVGGPSDYNKLHTVKGDFRPSLVTNIDPIDGIDDVADAGKLPYPSSSFGAVLAMGLPGRLRSQGTVNQQLHSDFLHEAARVIEPGGWLLMQAATREDLEQAFELGFTMQAGSGAMYAQMCSSETRSLNGAAYTEPQLYIEFLLQR